MMSWFQSHQSVSFEKILLILQCCCVVLLCFSECPSCRVQCHVFVYVYTTRISAQSKDLHNAATDCVAQSIDCADP